MNEEHIVVDDLAKLEFIEVKHQVKYACSLCEK
jgi:hypothetical protein